MKTDRDDKLLLDLAAKAARVTLYWPDDATFDVGFAIPLGPLRPNHKVREKRDWVTWNPLADDGDALRLAVRLDIQIWRRPSGVEGVHKGSVLTNPQTESLTPDPYAATRRAIVRAAAEIGKAMP